MLVLACYNKFNLIPETSNALSVRNKSIDNVLQMGDDSNIKLRRISVVLSDQKERSGQRQIPQGAMRKGLLFIKFYSAHEKGMGKKSLKKKSNLIFSIIFCIAAIVFVLSFAMLMKYYWKGSREEKAFTELAAGITETLPKESVPDQQEMEIRAEYAETQQYTEYQSLYEQNNDFAGWLHIDNTKIDYPVMCTPNDPEYYLRRAFDKTSSQSGTPFIGKDSTADSDVFIIYGHNMKNNTMFGTLDDYSEKTFADENPYIEFATATEHRTYEVFAAVKTRILYQGESGYRYYEHAGNLNESDFEELVQWLREKSLYDTEVVPEYGEQIVILSTCSYHTDNGRFIVAARRTD